MNTDRPSQKSTRPIGEVRIIGGSLKRSKLAVLDRSGLRPTPDRVRETLFNWLSPSIEGAKVLDLCAGTGVLGMEALSRGASFAWFNEPDSTLAELIIANGQRLKILAQMHITRLPAQQLLASRAEQGFDLAFVDPPYQANLWSAILEKLPTWLSPNALVYLEHPCEVSLQIDPCWKIHKQGRAGRVDFYLLQPRAAESAHRFCGAIGNHSGAGSALLGLQNNR